MTNAAPRKHKRDVRRDDRPSLLLWRETLEIWRAAGVRYTVRRADGGYVIRVYGQVH